MNIYTSYWAQVRNFPKNLIGLNTTVWPPKWRPLGQDKRGVLVVDCPPLKPGASCEGLCNGKCNPKDPEHCQFLQTYYAQLQELNVEQFLGNLERIAQQFKEDEHIDEDIDFALIVFESPTNPCSERIPIQAWGAFTGLEIKEWKPNI